MRIFTLCFSLQYTQLCWLYTETSWNQWKMFPMVGETKNKQYNVIAFTNH